MGSISLPSTSGHGSQALGATVLVNQIAALLVTAGPLVRIDGFTPVERLHQCAWFGVGFAPGGAGPATITFDAFMRLEGQSLGSAAFPLGQGDTFYWDLTSGTLVTFFIGW